ncbi:hypothetical protein B0I08_10424 [Glaciihabitans tibetensis]|uniref:Uncharacterized protein n=1 Tax=Glaciihabitans tibetensis TaxID=1266600 RepID=A0A2T0VDW9_9MICO|nr:hypothetical protein [Glaciihabitans tibetensis]PRY68322.1 hypothetical protein B0I08_10424 [Glaciihabitans tibetensis]
MPGTLHGRFEYRVRLIPGKPLEDMVPFQLGKIAGNHFQRIRITHVYFTCDDCVESFSGVERPVLTSDQVKIDHALPPNQNALRVDFTIRLDAIDGSGVEVLPYELERAVIDPMLRPSEKRSDGKYLLLAAFDPLAVTSFPFPMCRFSNRLLVRFASETLLLCEDLPVASKLGCPEVLIPIESPKFSG